MKSLGWGKRAAQYGAIWIAAALGFSGTCAGQTNPEFENGLAAPAIEDFSTGPVLLPSLVAPTRMGSIGLGEAAGAAPLPGPMDISYNTWEFDAGAVFTRFRSSLYYASMLGFRTSVAYHFNDWVAADGGITTGFAPEIFAKEHIKYLDYMAGIRLGPRQDRYSPWAHAQIGGAHILPQTAGNSKNSLAVKAGVGVDYRVNSVIGLRGQMDWLRTRFFQESQNNFQASVSLVIHFDRIF